MEDFYRDLRELLPEESIRCQEPMARHTTFRIGGPAAYYAVPPGEEAFVRTVALCRRRKMPWYVVGKGSNLLVNDQGYAGVILSTEGLDEVHIEGEEMRASAGALLSRMARAAAKKALTGLEFAAGIPGTLGGAVVMNAGAYGSEMRDRLIWAKVLDGQGRVITLGPDELELGYRRSCIQERGYVVLEAGLKLSPGNREEILSTMEELAGKRREKQPLEYPSAGSTFKRPAGYFAGKLIDDAGLRGYRVGDAQVSEKHCGFVVNRGQATAAQVLLLCAQVRQRVRQQFGVELEMEVRQL